MANDISVLANSAQIIRDFGDSIPSDGLAFHGFEFGPANTCTFTFGFDNVLARTPVTRAWGDCDWIVLQFSFSAQSLSVEIQEVIGEGTPVDLKFTSGSFLVDANEAGRFSFRATFRDMPGLRLVIKPKRL